MLDIAIIGGGPAGLTAGLYASRGGVQNVVLFDPGMTGGQITSSSEIENYPGQFEVVSGLELMQNWLPQAQRFGLKQEMDEVTRIEKSGGIFKLTTIAGLAHEAKAVVFATGSVPKKAGFADEEQFLGRGVHTCATCDGFFYKGKEVVVIGGGNAALEEAFFLSKICAKVYLIHRRDAFNVPPATLERIKNTPNIETILKAKPIAAVGDAKNGVTGLKIAQEGRGEFVLNAPGVFVFVGRTVQTSALADENGGFICAIDKNGEIEVDLKMKTSVEGLFAAGDVRSLSPKQVICAAGDGAVAALSAIAYLEHLEHKA